MKKYEYMIGYSCDKGNDCAVLIPLRKEIKSRKQIKTIAKKIAKKDNCSNVSIISYQLFK
jgi:hypothetical protein